MKGFALVLLCALVAVQARHTGLVKKEGSLAALGENPWVVHLRIAVSTSGLLETCAGTLIGDRWVLTAAACVANARFIWIRYGVVDVISPSLVTETSASTTNGPLALININRAVEANENIAPASLPKSKYASGKVCLFGGDESGPGSQLKCSDVNDVVPTPYDLGAGVVSDGELTGILVEDGIIPIKRYLDWVEAETGVSPDAEDSRKSEVYSVNFVN